MVRVGNAQCEGKITWGSFGSAKNERDGGILLLHTAAPPRLPPLGEYVSDGRYRFPAELPPQVLNEFAIARGRPDENGRYAICLHVPPVNEGDSGHVVERKRWLCDRVATAWSGAPYEVCTRDFSKLTLDEQPTPPPPHARAVNSKVQCGKSMLASGSKHDKAGMQALWEGLSEAQREPPDEFARDAEAHADLINARAGPLALCSTPPTATAPRARGATAGRTAPLPKDELIISVALQQLCGAVVVGRERAAEQAWRLCGTEARTSVRPRFAQLGGMEAVPSAEQTARMCARVEDALAEAYRELRVLVAYSDSRACDALRFRTKMCIMLDSDSELGCRARPAPSLRSFDTTCRARSTA